MFVYVMKNDGMPGLVKVGYSTDPVERAYRLSSSAAVPLPFEVLHAERILFEHLAQKAEMVAHSMLDRYRVNDAREFFRVGDDNVAVQAVIISVFVVSRSFVLPTEWDALRADLEKWPLTIAGQLP